MTGVLPGLAGAEGPEWGGVRILVYGEPQTQGNKSAFAIRRKDAAGQWQFTGRAGMREGRSAASEARFQSWRGLVAEQASAAMGQGEPLAGPLAVVVTFTVKRPAGHFRESRGRPTGEVRPSAPAWPSTRPDLSKYLRAVEDSMTDAGVYGDDAQIVAVHAFKCYPRPAYGAGGLAAVAVPNPDLVGAGDDALERPGVVIRVWRLG